MNATETVIAFLDDIEDTTETMNYIEELSDHGNDIWDSAVQMGDTARDVMVNNDNPDRPTLAALGVKDEDVDWLKVGQWLHYELVTRWDDFE